METLRVPRRRFLKGTGAIAGIQLAGARLPFPFSALSPGSLRDAEDFAFDSFHAIRAGPDRAGWRTGPD